MSWYKISARLLAPLLIQKNRQTFTPQTLEYLPGSTLRGALAGAYLRTGGSPEDQIFNDLFGVDGPCFPALLPNENINHIPGIIPKTAVSCKRRPGFKGQNGHGVRDGLTMLAANRSTSYDDPQFWRCPICANDTVPFNGIWNQDINNPAKQETTIIMQRHTGVDRATGTIAQGIFYASQIIREESGQGKPEHLAGRFKLSDGNYHILEKLLSQGPIFAGADRVRGLGEMRISLQQIPKPEIDVQTWSNKFIAKYKKDTGQELTNATYFSLSLSSPAIFVDKFLRPDFKFTLDFPDLELLGKTASQTLIRGWQSTWNLPKPDDPAIEAGSVFLFRYQGKDISGLQDYLQKLQSKSLGLRLSEGFGQLQICDELHIREEL